MKQNSINGKILLTSRNNLKSFSTDNDETIFKMMSDILSRNENETDIIKLEANKTWHCFISLSMTEDTADTIRAFTNRNIESIAKNSIPIPISRGK